MSYSSNNFPPDLLFDLLSRLRAKEVVKFKSVSKLWSSIIDDPKFSCIHANRLSDSACQSPSSTTQICLCKHRDSGDRRQVSKLCEIKWSGGIDGVIEEFRPLPDEISDKCVKLVGSSNGVLCLVCEGDTNVVILWNPLSRKYHSLPPLPTPPWTYMYTYRYGFGYDKVNDDYKVLCFEINSSISSDAFVYSRKLNTWRTMDDEFPVPSDEEEEMVVPFGGALHWISEEEDSIIAFDLSNEEFKRFAIPIDCCAQLGIMQDGRLYMIVATLEGHCVLRLMFNYDDWREFMFGPETGVINALSLIPIAYVETPKPVVMIRLGKQLGFFDIEEQSFIYGEVSNIDGDFDRELFPYIQTLQLY